MARRRTDYPIHMLADSLASHYGESGWWPADSPFEVMVGAILVQNTAWRNVETAMANLKDAGLMEPRALAASRLDTLRRLVKPEGYFNQKSERIKRFAGWIVEEFAGDVARMRARPLEAMRRALLDFNGIGPETADSMLCYALDHPIFVADAYTRRIFSRHGLCGEYAGYAELQATVMDALPKDRHRFAELHGHIVFVGKDFCRRRAPECARCPLDGWHDHHA